MIKPAFDLKRAWHLTMASILLTLNTTHGDAADDVSVPSSTPDLTKTRIVNVALNDVLVVAEEKGWIKEEFDKLNASVNLVPSSPANVPALFERGGLDIANSMLGISLLQLINGFHPVIVWTSTPIDPRFITIVTLKESPIKSLADLKGKTIGAAQWTCPHYAAYEALKSAGLTLESNETPGDVHFLNTGEGVSATSLLLSGKVDALAGLSTGFSQLYLQGVVKDLSTSVPNGWYVQNERVFFYARPKWANENPDLIQAFLRAQEKAVLWIRAHPSEGAEIVFNKLRHPKDLVEFQFKEPGNNRMALPERDFTLAVTALKNFQSIALSTFSFLHNKRSLSDEEINQLFDKRFFKGGAYSLEDNEIKTEHQVSQNSVPPQSSP